ncbi:MAG TPA: cyclase family protein [Gryllotalpicola sp.]
MTTTTARAVEDGSARALPGFRELPREPGGARQAWGLFGPDDSAGLMNLISPEGTREAARLVERGAVFPLDVRLGFVDPPFFDRGLPRHTLIQRRPGSTFDDVYDNLFPQASSQWDSLAHVAARPEEFYNGATRAEIVAGLRNTVDHWARRGIATRGIVLDVAARVAERGGPGAGIPITVADLEEARRSAGLEYRPGDILLVHTGFLAWYGRQDRATRVRLSRRESTVAPGLERSEAMSEYVWNAHVAGVASDTVGLEVWPGAAEPGPYGSLHRIFIGLYGLAIGELWWLDELVRDCAEDGRYEVFLTSAPWNFPGATGTPPNALALK